MVCDEDICEQGRPDNLGVSRIRPTERYFLHQNTTSLVVSLKVVVVPRVPK